MGYTLVGTDREVDPVAAVPGAGDGIHVQGKVVPICTIQQGQIPEKTIRRIERGWKDVRTHPC